MKTPNLLVVPALLWAAAAAAITTEQAPPAPLTETFRDWVLLAGRDDKAYLARRDDFAPVYARQREAGAVEVDETVPVYAFQYTDGENPILDVTATPVAGKLRVYRRIPNGPVPMAVRLDGTETDISLRLHEEDRLNRPVDARLPAFRGGWERRIRVRGSGEGQPALFSSDAAVIDRLPEALRLPAATLLHGDRAAFLAVMRKAQDGQDVAPDLAHTLHGYPPEQPPQVPPQGPVDVWGLMHPVEKAVISRLPAADQAAFRQKIAAARTPAAATALLGEIRRASTAFIQSGGDAGALDTLRAAMSRIARASINEDTGAVTFDGAAATQGAVVTTGGDRPQTPQDPQSVVNSAPQRIDSSIRPVPGPGRPMSGESGGIGGMLGGLTQSPLFAAGSGALAGALIGFAVGGPFGAFFGALVGMPLGLAVGKLFGMKYGE